MLITNTKSLNQTGLKFLIFGEPGVGKTTLAKTVEEKTLIISAESGLLSLAGSDIDVLDLSTDDKGVSLPKEKRLFRLAEAYKYLNEVETQKKYSWVFLDSLTEIFQNLVEQLQTEYPDSKDTIKMWGEYNKRGRSLIKSFRDLPHYNVCFTALAKEDKDENGKRFIRVDVNGGIAHQMPAFFDLVFYYYIAPDGSRKLLTGKQDNVVAKDRSGKLDKMEDPNLDAISKKIRAKANATNKS